MANVGALGDAFIWITSILAGILLLVGGYRTISARSVSQKQRAILGDWFGYAFYHSDDGDVFYKEHITVSRRPAMPWRLRLSSESIQGSGETKYSGRIYFRNTFFYCSSYEPTFDDTAYEISRLLMGDTGDADMIVGICLGITFNKLVHCANVYIWSRKELDPLATKHRSANVDVEKEAFLKIAKKYFVISPETYQLKMF